MHSFRLYTSAGKCGGFIYAANNVDTVIIKDVNATMSGAEEDGGLLYLENVRSFQAISVNFSYCHTQNQGGAVAFINSDHPTISFEGCVFILNSALSGMGKDVLISYKSGSKYNVNRKNFIKCNSSTDGHRVTLLPKVRHADWTDTHFMNVLSLVTSVVIGGCVLLAIGIVLICVCCCCGCCAACCCGKKKTDAYEHVKSQPKASYVAPHMHSNDYPPQKVEVGFSINS
ncbi:hypothetical protein BLNAU_10738 [Blattamonas nauphoetae]|uniref:Right handed beta helix domain-containing protein n=1 Tax=Blattamonas nauphoetae TaxID=2049346 RepID=A0ABQ9XRD4_9EUKA|nr:hypothetical protein BLNAU_10738 [Blattamonas nauphoetae]